MDSALTLIGALHLGNLEKGRHEVSQDYEKSVEIGRLFSQNHLVCDVTIILSVKELLITIFELTRD